MTDTILYVAATDAAADDGAAALERAGSNLAVEPAADVETVRERAPDADCLVFAETPTTAEGAHLLEVLDVREDTPVVLYTDASFSPAAARSTDGVDGYVRRAGESSVAHLADEVTWVCREAGDADATARSAVEGVRDLAARLENCRDGDLVLEYALEAAETVLEADACAVFRREPGEDGDRLAPAAVSAGASGGGIAERRPDEGVIGRAVRDGPHRVDDVDEAGVAPALGPCRSAIGVPIGEFGALLAVDEGANAFDGGDLAAAELLGGLVDAALDRLGLEARRRERRDRAAELRASASRLAAAPDETALYELAVAAVGRIFDVDDCAVLVREDDALLTRAQTSSAPADGANAWTVVDHARDALEREAVLVDEEGGTRPTGVDGADANGGTGAGCGSIVSVPVGRRGVLQFVVEGGEFDAVDRALAAVFAATIDGTAGRLAAEAALEVERDRLEALFEAVPDPVVRYEVVDGTAIVRAGNERFEAVFGDHESAPEAAVEDLLVPPPDADADVDPTECLHAGGTERAVARGADDREFVVQAAPLRASDGDDGVAVFTDVTDLTRLERDLAAREARLEGVATAVDDDLREQLNLARAYLELVEGTGDPELFEEVDAAHERLGELFDRLQEVARGEVPLEDVDVTGDGVDDEGVPTQGFVFGE